jgi:hypothetical protein
MSRKMTISIGTEDGHAVAFYVVDRKIASHIEDIAEEAVESEKRKNMPNHSLLNRYLHWLGFV